MMRNTSPTNNPGTPIAPIMNRIVLTTIVKIESLAMPRLTTRKLKIANPNIATGAMAISTNPQIMSVFEAGSSFVVVLVMNT